MRLVDADVENEKLLGFISAHDALLVHAIQRENWTDIKNIFSKYFESQKTAFDLDKVINRLERMAAQANDDIEATCSPKYYDGKEDGIAESLEIVKGGVLAHA